MRLYRCLEVHKDFRGKGVGRTLVNKAVDIAREKNCDTIAVWPVEEAIGFYQKCGLKNIAYKTKWIEIELDESKHKKRDKRTPHQKNFVIKEPPKEHTFLEKLTLITRRIFTTYTLWLKHKLKFAIEKERIIRTAGYIEHPKAIFFIKSKWNEKTTGILDMWVEKPKTIPKTLDIVIENSREKGYKKLLLNVDEKILERFIPNHHIKVVGEETVLYKKLK